MTMLREQVAAWSGFGSAGEVEAGDGVALLVDRASGIHDGAARPWRARRLVEHAADQVDDDQHGVLVADPQLRVAAGAERLLGGRRDRDPGADRSGLEDRVAGTTGLAWSSTVTAAGLLVVVGAVGLLLGVAVADPQVRLTTWSPSATSSPSPSMSALVSILSAVELALPRRPSGALPDVTG